jgi:hypothetical protein
MKLLLLLLLLLSSPVQALTYVRHLIAAGIE